MNTYEQLLADGKLTPEAAFGPEPGTGYVTDAKTGRVFLAHLPPPPEPIIQYVPQPMPELPKAPAPVQARDPWTARIGMGMGGTAAVLAVAGHYAHGLGEAGHAAEMAGLGVGAVTAAGALAIAMLKGSLGTKVNVTVNNSNTGSSSSSSASSSSSSTSRLWGQR